MRGQPLDVIPPVFIPCGGPRQFHVTRAIDPGPDLISTSTHMRSYFVIELVKWKHSPLPIRGNDRFSWEGHVSRARTNSQQRQTRGVPM